MAARLNLDLRQELGGRIRSDRFNESMGRQAVTELKRKTTSYWPVRTGYSKRNFYSEYNERNGVVSIRNRADYAVYVERRTGAARRTLRRRQNRKRIIAAGRAALERELANAQRQRRRNSRARARARRG